MMNMKPIIFSISSGVFFEVGTSFMLLFVNGDIDTAISLSL